MKPCERCHKQHKGRDRYCKKCVRLVLAELKAEGAIDATPIKSISLHTDVSIENDRQRLIF